jgi:hypothetical protein
MIQPRAHWFRRPQEASMFADYVISTDPSMLEVGLIHRFLASSYWARGRS